MKELNAEKVIELLAELLADQQGLKTKSVKIEEVKKEEVKVNV